MKTTAKFAAIALASALAVSVITPAAVAAPTCAKKANVTMLGTIKPEIQTEFLAAVKAYNASQNCYTVKSLPGDR
jgi:raffinose/stachyose/melibiose transport system substrate-binding protein